MRSAIEELARILGGAEITATVRQSAREMKELAVLVQKHTSVTRLDFHILKRDVRYGTSFFT